MEESKRTVDNIIHMFECPVELEPIRTAMHLHPCAHKINQTALERLIPNEDGEIFCPLCRHRIEDSYPDPTIRSIVKALLETNPPKTLPKVAARLQADNPEIDTEDDYPGNGAQFYLETNRWRNFHNNTVGCFHHHIEPSYLQRELRFKTITHDALFSEIVFLGYRDGHVTISIKVAQEKMYKPVAIFLEQRGFSLDDHDRIFGRHSFSHPEEKKVLFQILTQNNLFEEKDLELMRSIIEKC